jgi:demethylmenaquinone methyltransferase / 2-methoxy-6-polyprenyl-1,4-benzoquinol methylase
VSGSSERGRHARQLFSTLGPAYDRMGAVLSFGQDPRWRRFMVARLPEESPGRTVLDVATGTGLVAERLLARGFTVTGLDQSPEMLAEARRRFGERVTLVEASADELPFADASFDHLTFTYLLRYVDDPAATLRELARVVRPGGTIASLEFCVPRGVWRPPWDLYVRAGLPAAGRLVSPGWHEVGRFLGPSIREFWARWPLERQVLAWQEAGVRGVRHRRMSLGGGIVMWGRRGGAPVPAAPV